MPRYLFLAVLVSGCAAPAIRRFDLAGESGRPPAQNEASEAGLENAFTLPQAVGLALARNPGLRSARERVGAARERITREGSLDEPWVNLEAGPVPWSGVGPGRSESMYGLRQMVPFPGKLGLRADAAASMALARLEESLEKGNAVAAAVETAFFELVQARRELEVHREHEQILEDVLRVAEAHYRAGRVMQADVLKAQAALVMVHNEVVFVEQRIGVARLQLNVLMGREPGAPLGDPVAIDVRAVPVTAEEAETRALAARPELRASRHMLEGAEQERDLAKREAWLPDFEVGVDYVRMPMEESDGWRAMVAFSLPWFGAGRHAAVREAGREVEARRAGLRADELETARMARDAFLAVRATRDSLTLQKGELLPLARQALEALRTNYENNAASFLDLLDAINTLLEAQIGAQKAEADYEKAVTELKRAVGGDWEVRR